MTLSQCKKLKEWGLPQGNCDYYGHMHDGDIGIHDWMNRFDGNPHPVHVASIPDLEQLLEFAGRKVQGRWGENFYIQIDYDADWVLVKPVGRNDAGCYDDWYGADPYPKVAVYKLLEKILGEDGQPERA